MKDIDELLEAKSKLQNPDSLLRELFMNKVTRDDRTVKQYTGAPSKTMLNGLFGKELISDHCNNSFVITRNSHNFSSVIINLSCITNYFGFFSLIYEIKLVKAL